MLKKICLFVAASAFLFVTACGTLLKPDQINRSHSKNLDITIVLLDSIGLLFLIIPGIMAFAIDHTNGTLYLPKGKISLNDTSVDGVYKALVSNGYNLSKEQVELAMEQAS